MRKLIVLIVSIATLGAASPAMAKEHGVTRTLKDKTVTVRTDVFASNDLVMVEVRQRGKAIEQIGSSTRTTAFWANKCVVARATTVWGKAAPVTFKLINLCNKRQKVTVVWEVVGTTDSGDDGGDMRGAPKK